MTRTAVEVSVDPDTAHIDTTSDDQGRIQVTIHTGHTTSDASGGDSGTVVRLVLDANTADRLIVALAGWVDQYRHQAKSALLRELAPELLASAFPSASASGAATLTTQHGQGRRHALMLIRAMRPYPGDTFTALCGDAITTTARDYPEYGGPASTDRTRLECQRHWQQLLDDGRVTDTGQLVPPYVLPQRIETNKPAA